VARGGAPIEVEVWSLDAAGLGAVTAEVPPPLAIGTLELADGRWVKGFVCEPLGLLGATDITASGGWRRHLASADDA
jgi:allophanate hydrolase